MKHRVLIIDDEAKIRQFIRFSLVAEGFDVAEADTASAGLGLIKSCSPDVVILDLGLPDKEGLWVLRQIRVWSKIPVLILTARDDEDDKVTLLNAGANDYLSKPFSIKELIARVRVLLRDLTNQALTPAQGVLEFDGLVIDLKNHLVWRNNTPVNLARKEFLLLSLLARHPERLLTQAYLLKEVWGEYHTKDTHYLRGLISQLRKKLEQDSSAPNYIITEPGVGYRFTPRPSPS